MSHWNFRLVDLTAQNDGEKWITIQEVYYEDDKPVGYASATVGGESAEEVKQDLLRMLTACDLPTLVVDAKGQLMTVDKGENHAEI
jgi:hypothetical protein